LSETKRLTGRRDAMWLDYCNDIVVTGLQMTTLGPLKSSV